MMDAAPRHRTPPAEDYRHVPAEEEDWRTRLREAWPGLVFGLVNLLIAAMAMYLLARSW